MPSIDDWQPYTHNVEKTVLDFNIEDDYFEVESRLDVERKDPSVDSPLFLNGRKVELLRVWVDDSELGNNEYTLDDDGLTIHSLPEQANVRITQRVPIDPNAVDGLYRSDETLVTQCEDEAFRKIAFFPDRPDVLSKFEVRIEADQSKYPILLSNGNEINRETLEDGRHAVTYEDEFAKPCYLFALVAGDLASLHSEYKTAENRTVELSIYSTLKSIRHCSFAMAALKRAMYWDERVYNRYYDLDRFSIVAVDKFLFGAMENKSLNVFNTQALHASPDVATDANYERIEGIVAHEYFHNYSGNRVTVRDWFQLSLKEGFTVFRDQSFTSNRIGEGLGRVINAEHLRNEQFPEAQSSLAHPVQPREMTVPANYYTRTIYEGGAELIYMLSNWIGNRWSDATDHYFEKFDHQAVTIDDFVEAISESTNTDFEDFKLWYSTSGIPQVLIEEERKDGAIKLTLSQHIPPTADQAEKPDLPIPIGIGLLDTNKSRDWMGRDGRRNGVSLEISTSLAHTISGDSTRLFVLNVPKAEIVINRVGAPITDEVLVSAHRAFSAPIELSYVKAETGETDYDRLVQLVFSDTDSFVRWDSAQRLYAASIVDWDSQSERVHDVVSFILGAEFIYVSPEQRRLLAHRISLPSMSRVLDLHKQTPVEKIIEGRDLFRQEINKELGPKMSELLAEMLNRESDNYEPSNEQISYRAMQFALMQFLVYGIDGSEAGQVFLDQLVKMATESNNLTSRRNALQLLLQLDNQEELQEEVSQNLYNRFQHEPLFVDKWVTDLVGIPKVGAEDRIAQIDEMGLLDELTPNRWRATFSSYAANWHAFHRSDGSGYDYYTDRLLQDAETMGGVISRGVQPLAYYHRHDSDRAAKMKESLFRLQQDLPSSHETARDMVDRALREVPSRD